MRIRSVLILTNRIPWPLNDGGALGMHFIIEGYKQAGIKVHLLSMNTSRHKVNDVQLKQLYKNIDSFETVAINNDISPLKILQNLFFSKLPEHVNRFYSKKYEQAIANAVQQYNPDAIHMESPFMASYIQGIKRYSSKPILLRVNNIEYQIWERLAASEKGIKKLYFSDLAERIKRYEEQIWGQFDALLCVTKEDMDIIAAQHYTNKSIYTPFGIDTSVLPEKQIHAPLLNTYHIGAMDWIPNVDAVEWILTEIWPEVIEHVPNATFHFAGRNMPVNFAPNLPKGTYNHGEVASLQTFIADKGTLLVPLRAGGGIRVKILEAMALGKLVISTDVGIQGIEAEDNKHFIRANSPNEFATAIQWVAIHPKEAQAIANAGKELIREQYSMRTIFNHLLGELDSMV